MLHQSRRRSERILTNWRASLCGSRGGMTATVTDASLEGLFVRTRELPEIGQVVWLMVELPDGPMEVFGVVRFVGETIAGRGAGIELLPLGTRNRERWINAYQGLEPGLRKQPLAMAA